VITCLNGDLKAEPSFATFKRHLTKELGECYRLNQAIVVQAACQAVVCRTMCLQADFELLAYGTHFG